MTLRELSKKSGVSLGYISELELGKKDASSEMLEDLCTSLDMSLEEFLHGTLAVLAA